MIRATNPTEPRTRHGRLLTHTITMLSLNGKAKRTQEEYARAIRKLVEFYGRPPSRISQEELAAYFHHRRTIDGWSESGIRIAFSAVRFYFEQLLGRRWRLARVLRPRQTNRLPTVLARTEVIRLFECVEELHHQTFLRVVYGCGLRLQEALRLEVGDIDSERMTLQVRNGKGARDRLIPLSKQILCEIRAYWMSHRNPRLIFPGRGHDGRIASTNTRPMSESTVRNAMHKALARAQIMKRNVTLHTLRHSWATHLLEEGVSLRAIQQLLGHSTIRSTIVYLHLTTRGNEVACAAIERLTARE